MVLSNIVLAQLSANLDNFMMVRQQSMIFLTSGHRLRAQMILLGNLSLIPRGI